MKNTPIRIFDDRGVAEPPADGSKIIGFELDIFGRHLDFRIVSAGNARLADIVPAAGIICDKIIDVTSAQIRIRGGNIPCRKACPACCSYLVSLSVPEALCFKREISREQKYQLNHTLRIYLNAAKKITKNRPPNQFLHLSSKPDKSDSLKTLSDWYAGLNLACPFLCNDKCAIYEHRPFACREHFVIGSARGCRECSGRAQVIKMPVQMGNVLCRLSRELCDVDDAVMMPLALSWCDINKSLSERTWPAEVMTKRFVEILKESVSVPVYHPFIIKTTKAAPHKAQKNRQINILP